MLVLSRKVGEKIVIGNNITLVVQRIGKGRVALAIDAPHDIPVLRAELAPFGVEVDGEVLEVEEEDTLEDDPSSTHSKRPTQGKSSGRLRTGFPRPHAPRTAINEIPVGRISQAVPAR